MLISAAAVMNYTLRNLLEFFKNNYQNKIPKIPKHSEKTQKNAPPKNIPKNQKKNQKKNPKHSKKKIAKSPKKNSIAFGREGRLDSQPICQLVRQAVSQTERRASRQPHRKHTVWVFSAADSAIDSGKRNDHRNKQWFNGNAADRRHGGRRFESRSADCQRPTCQLCSI